MARAEAELDSAVGGGADLAVGQAGEWCSGAGRRAGRGELGNTRPGSESRLLSEDLLLRARHEGAAQAHRVLHQSPISAEVLRGGLGIGSAPARRLVKVVCAEIQENSASEPADPSGRTRGDEVAFAVRPRRRWCAMCLPRDGAPGSTSCTSRKMREFVGVAVHNHGETTEVMSAGTGPASTGKLMFEKGSP